MRCPAWVGVSGPSGVPVAPVWSLPQCHSPQARRPRPAHGQARRVGRRIAMVRPCLLGLPVWCSASLGRVRAPMGSDAARWPPQAPRVRRVLGASQACPGRCLLRCGSSSALRRRGVAPRRTPRRGQTGRRAAVRDPVSHAPSRGAGVCGRGSGGARPRVGQGCGGQGTCRGWCEAPRGPSWPAWCLGVARSSGHAVPGG